MSPSFEVLRSIQEVDWVVGSFVANRQGELLMYLMPPELGEEMLARTAARLDSIVRSAELCGLEVADCEFSFSRHRLWVSRQPQGMLCVVAEAPVSRHSLALAMRLALAELPVLIHELEAERATISASAPVPGSVGGQRGG